MMKMNSVAKELDSIDYAESLFITNLPYGTDQVDLLKFFAKILHGERFGFMKINFDLKVITSKNKSQFAVLSLPYAAQVDLFLEFYGKSGIKFNGRTIKFGPNLKEDRKSHESLLERLRNESWIDIEEQMALDERRSVWNIESVSFGFQNWDLSFSEEYYKDFNIHVNPCELSYVAEKRRIIISDPLTQTDVVIQRHNIVNIIKDSSKDALWFMLKVPCSFENSGLMHSSFSGENDVHAVFDDKSLLKRLQQVSAGATTSSGLKKLQGIFEIQNMFRIFLECWNKDHLPAAPFTSTSFVLTFPNSFDLRQFVQKLHVNHFPRTLEQPITVVFERNAYSTANQQKLEQWFKKLPIPVAYCLEYVYRNRILDPTYILALQKRINDLIPTERKCVEILWMFATAIQEIDSDPEYIDVSKFLDRFDQIVDDFDKWIALEDDDDSIYSSMNVCITPTAFFVGGVCPDQTNRVLRRYYDNIDSFLRVTFTDEESLQQRFDMDVDRDEYLKRRVGSFLKNGLHFCGRRYDFLGYSSSCLRSHSVYFVTPFEDNGVRMDATAIRATLGDFSKEMYFPARYGARLAQTFTATKSSIILKKEELRLIPDVENGDCVFTDGCGKISLELAKRIWKNVEKKGSLDGNLPTTFQFRLGGMKGMVSVDYHLEGSLLCYRPSMAKFSSTDLNFEVVKTWLRPGSCYLNRPFIQILESLGVPASSFLKLQDDAVKKTFAAFKTFKSANRFLGMYGLGQAFRIPSLLDKLPLLLNMELSELMRNKSMVIYKDIDQVAQLHVLRELRSRARIPVPGSYLLVGVADEWGFLKDGEVYVCVDDPVLNTTEYLSGPVCISRSPALHPGDVQMATAVGKVPDEFGLSKIKNAIVFSVDTWRGRRSLPSKLGGGDLDGDEYMCITNKELHLRRNIDAYTYPAAPKLELDHPTTIEDISDFVVNYMSADTLGIVCTQHMLNSDMQPKGVFHRDSITLAGFASRCVDFVKSGTPVLHHELPVIDMSIKPDFMLPETKLNGRENIDFYKSQRALGQLYRAVKIPERLNKSNQWKSKKRTLGGSFFNRDVTHSNTPDVLSDPISKALISVFNFGYPVTEEMKTYAERILMRFSQDLTQIAYNNSLNRKRLSETELLLGTISEYCRQQGKRRDLIQSILKQTELLEKKISREIMSIGGEEKGESDDEIFWIMNRAWSLWVCSRENMDVFGSESLGIIALHPILDYLKNAQE